MSEKLKTFKFDTEEIKLIVYCIDKHTDFLENIFHDTDFEDGPAKTGYEMVKRIRGYLQSVFPK